MALGLDIQYFHGKYPSQLETASNPNRAVVDAHQLLYNVAAVE